ncbi:MAG: ABC transporter permease [Lachnospiraceae bacterium]|nr:ABC transporter permease [Lachnospiraceae bacterium]
MKPGLAFIKKEWMEMFRSSKMTILLILFVLFGIMSPALAKLTPALYEMVADSMKEQGITISQIEVTALTSWTQYFKNAFMELVVLVCMFSGILTNEYQKGTLIPMYARGLSRGSVLFAKMITTLTAWTLCYYLCFGITYAYNAYFWDHDIVSHLALSVFCLYLLGVWLITVIFAISALLSSGTAVMLATGGIFAGLYFVGMIPKISKYLPVTLLNAGDLVTGNSSIKPGTAFTEDTCLPAIIVTLVLCVFNYVIACVLLKRKRV